MVFSILSIIAPVLTSVIELNSGKNTWAIVHNVGEAVNKIVANKTYNVQVRSRSDDGCITIVRDETYQGPKFDSTSLA